MTDPLQHTLRFFSPFDPEDEFEISFGEGDFPTLEFPHPSQINTMAVVHIRNGKVRGLGTCFAISSQGLVVTARHVMEQVNPTAADPTKENSEFFGALYISREKIPDSPGNYVGGILPIRKVWSNNLLDIALMLVELPVHKETGKPLPVAMMPLSPGLPETNQYCVGMGYSSMEWEKGKPGWPEVSQKYNATRGVIEEIHFPGRDQRLNFPCFLTNARFDLGMSGGPIFSQEGQICGVICSGTEITDPTIPSISYGSLIPTAPAVDSF